MNRIATAIERQTANITARLADGRTTQEQLDKLHGTLDMDILEFVRFQELKSLACVTNKLSFDEAQLLYNLLGPVVTHFNAQPVAVKIILTQTFAELLAGRRRMG